MTDKIIFLPVETRPRNNLTGKKILLVDDNLTSGNTAGKCAELLKNNGAEKLSHNRAPCTYCSRLEVR